MLDETEFLSPYGIRSVSALHRERPYSLQVNGSSYVVRYEPAESTTGLFGGNSNWRGAQSGWDMRPGLFMLEE